jgi:G3E family GTPase
MLAVQNFLSDLRARKNRGVGFVEKIIPVYVIAGFLGSGKTTLLTRALEAYNLQGFRPVVIMNELGDVNLDGVAVNEGGGDVPMAELLSGCICCTIRSDLSLQLHELVTAYAPDAVFIESTGVANPIEIMDAVTEASLYLPISLDAVVTVMDGAFVADMGTRPLGKTGRLLRDQVRCASQVLLNKVDRLTPEAADRAEALLREWNAHAPILRTIRCEVELGRVFAASDRVILHEAHVCSPECGHAHGEDAHVHHHTHDHVSVFTHFLASPIDSRAFEAFMKSLPAGVYRAKGIVTFTDTASRFLFQFAYRELDFTRIQPQGHVNDVAVFIGEQFPKAELAAGLTVLERGKRRTSLSVLSGEWE